MQTSADDVEAGCASVGLSNHPALDHIKAVNAQDLCHRLKAG